ncbi:MFS transporter [Lichenibacterium ramalinae]|uniref:MFS transporter n=1 Tax=Lichenibacterium ramalinae TaxID=2316527 RepID=A0A4Q2RCT3_9HYPH|nr:MFS transporter [Lichenibacterium ramalinae]RYB04435.1 MFS transporter [Lichenibacterium ramalinae]
MTSETGSSDELSDGGVGVLAAVVAVTVANGYYVQPLLLQIGAAADLSAGLVSLLPALTQVGLGIGLITLLPLADSLTARRLLIATLPLQVTALLAVAMSGSAVPLMAGCLAIGLFGVTPYVLPPYASLRVGGARLGAVTGLLTRGVICGILLARVVAGLVADWFGWRAVYALAAAATAGALGVVAVVVRPQGSIAPTLRYRHLIASLFSLLRTEPELRVAALCQALTFASFNAFWLGSTLYLHARFGWGPGAIGAVGLIGAASAFGAPVLGRSAQRFGPRRARQVAIAAMLVAWLLFAVLRESLIGLALALVVLDLGAVVQDVSSRTILYARAPQVRTRLNAVYTVSMFAGGGLSSAAVGACWTIGGWTGICWFGGATAAAAAIAAARGVRSAHVPHPSQDARRTAVGHPDG